MQWSEEQRVRLQVISKTVSALSAECSRLQSRGGGRARRCGSFLSQKEMMCTSSRRVGKAIFSSHQPRPATPEILRSKEAGNAKTGFAFQSGAAAVTCGDASSSSHAAFEQQLRAGLQERLGAGLGVRGKAAVAALWAQLHLFLFLPASGLSRVAAFCLRCHVAVFICWLRRT